MSDTQIEQHAESRTANAGSSAAPAAIIYTHALLEGSMTFIKSHAEALNRFSPVYAGSHFSTGIDLPRDRTYVINRGSLRGKIREAIFRKWGWAPGFTKSLARHKPRILHAHFGTCGPSGMMLASKLDIPFVVTFHGQDATKKKSEALKSHRGRELEKYKHRMIQKAGAIIAVSDFIRDRLLEQSYPPEKVVVLRNGIDLNFFKPNYDQAKKPTILFVGRFVEKKGTEYLLEAAKILKRSNVRFDLLLLGSGPLEPKLREMVRTFDIPCRFGGFVDTLEVRQHLASASVVVVPSVTAANGDSEGLPTILLEAQAMKVPVVATRHSGIPEGVIEGRTAELVDERDSESLAEKILPFLQSPEKVSSYGEAGRRFISASFNINSQAKKLEELYLEVCSRYATTSQRR